MENHAGMCACGCGTATKPTTSTGRPNPVGVPSTFAPGHNMRGRPTHFYRRRDNRLVHRLRAERALGRPLPPKAVVHHADGTYNEHSTLVICPDQKYHFLLHVRMRVKAAGGDPNTDRLCHYCQQLKPMTAFYFSPKRPNIWHCRECRNLRSKFAKRRLRAALREGV